MSTMNPPALPSVSALRCLEPRPGGQWAVTEQSKDSYSLAYFMNGGESAICFTMRTCTTVEDISDHCGSLIYRYGKPHQSSENNQGSAENVCATTSQAFQFPKETFVQNEPYTSSHGSIVVDPLMMSNPMFGGPMASGEGTAQHQFASSQNETRVPFENPQNLMIDRQVMSEFQQDAFPVAENKTRNSTILVSRPRDDSSYSNFNGTGTPRSYGIWENALNNTETDNVTMRTQTPVTWTPPFSSS